MSARIDCMIIDIGGEDGVNGVYVVHTLEI